MEGEGVHKNIVDSAGGRGDSVIDNPAKFWRKLFPRECLQRPAHTNTQNTHMDRQWNQDSNTDSVYTSEPLKKKNNNQQ